MVSQQGSGSFWPRMILTHLIAVWIFIVIGNYLGNMAIEKYLPAESGISESSVINTSAPRPWIHKAQEQQNEIDGIDDSVKDTEDSAVVIAPVEIKNAEAVKAESAPAAESKTDSEAVSSDSGCVINFGSPSVKEDAEEIRDRLASEGVNCRITEIPIQNGTAYRITSDPYPSVKEAEAKIEVLKNLGIDAYLNE